MRYWSVVAGAEGRDYTDAFLKYGLAFVGGKSQEAVMGKVDTGDCMILRRGMSEVVAVGRVVERNGESGGDGDKDWLWDFDGWELPGYLYVEWHILPRPIKTRGLARGTIRQVHKTHLKELADKVLSDVPPATHLAPEPSPTKDIADEQILEFLVKEGLRPGSAEELTSALRRIRLLAKYYYENCLWADIREHETRTFLVMPLLLALGWAEQQLKIELGVPKAGRVDVACFSKPYQRDEKAKPNNSDCVLIIETKGFSSGLDYAPKQARAYATYFPSCEAFAVTNGYCYKMYKRDDSGEFPKQPFAYLNLLRPRDKYPLDPDNVRGALAVLQLLLPRSWLQT